MYRGLIHSLRSLSLFRTCNATKDEGSKMDGLTLPAVRDLGIVNTKKYLSLKKTF
jgi:hypothetical protein